MLDRVPQNEIHIANFSHAFNNDYVFKSQIIQGFLEAVLFMNGQTKEVKQAIAEYYAILIVAVYLKRLIKKFKLPDYAYGAPVEALIQFLEENILQTEKLQITNYKTILVEHELKGYPEIIRILYTRNLKKVENILNKQDFDRQYITDSEKELHQLVSENAHRQKNIIFFGWPTLLVISLALYWFIDSFNDEHPQLNALGCVVTGLLLRFCEMIYLNEQCIDSINKVLQISFERKTSPSEPAKNDAKVKPRSKKISFPNIQPDSKSESAENEFSHYKISVIPVSLFPENVAKAALRASDSNSKKKSSDNNSVSTVADEKKGEIVLPDYFGPAFSDIVPEHCKKLEGCGWNKASQVYGIWCVDETKCDVNSNIDSLRSTFSTGRVATSGNCIKKLKKPGYYEVRAAGSARVFGKELEPVNGKKAIVFAYYDAEALHDNNTNLHERILENLDRIIENFKCINLEMTSSQRLQR